MIWVLPGDALWNAMVPSGPSWTVTRFGIVVPGADQLRFETVGNVLASGKTVR